MIRANRFLLHAFCALSLVLAACESTPNNQSAQQSPTKHKEQTKLPPLASVPPINREKLPRLKSEYWDLVKTGTLRIGVINNAPPYSYEGPNGLTGFDIMLAKHLGQTLGVKVELVPLLFTEVITELTKENPKIDLGIANITKTARRAAQVNFSRPYLTISQAAIVEKRVVEGTRQGAEIQTRIYDSYADLAAFPGLKVAVSASTVPEIHAQRYLPQADLVRVENVQAGLKALQAGTVQAVVHDAPPLMYWLKQNGQLAYRYKALTRPVTNDQLCIALRKGDLEFLTWINVYLEELDSRGLIPKWRRTYLQQ